MIPLIIGAAIGAAMAIGGNSSSDKAALELYKKKAAVIVHGYNYNQNALTNAEKSTYYSAVGELYNLQINALQNNASVTAALNESGFEGRTSDKISKVVSGQTYRQRTAIKENYELQVSEIRSKKDSLYIQVNNELDNLQSETSDSMLGGFEKFMNVLNGAAMGAAMGAAGGAAGAALAGGAAGGAAGTAGLSATGAIGGAATNTVGASAGATFLSTTGTSVGSSAVSAGSSYLAATGSSFGSAGLGAYGLGVGATTSAGASSLALTGASATSLATSGVNSLVQTAPVSTSGSNAGMSFLEAFNSNYDKYKNVINSLNMVNAYTQQFSKRGRYV